MARSSRVGSMVKAPRAFGASSLGYKRGIETAFLLSRICSPPLARPPASATPPQTPTQPTANTTTGPTRTIIPAASALLTPEGQHRHRGHGGHSSQLRKPPPLTAVVCALFLTTSIHFRCTHSERGVSVPQKLCSSSLCLALTAKVWVIFSVVVIPY